jgi:anti-sigma regulatory factor (Ser/Thr protein kinase)
MIEPRTGDRIAELRQAGSDDGSDDRSTRAGARADSTFAETHRAIPGSVAVLRQRVAEFVTQAGLPPSMVERVKLAVSEAATNVVVHAYHEASEPGLIRVEADLAAGELRVTIADTGSGLRARHDSPGLGLGLAIIGQLADNFELLQGDSAGLCVLMRFAIPAASDS